MSHELPKAYDPSVIEERWAEYWVREQLFHVATPTDTKNANDKFTILLPPPNVTGRLHMGHMLNQTEMDILTRWHRMRGETSLWVPGTDHAGIATQMMVERQLATEGTSRKQLGRDAFVSRVWDWREEYGGAILGQMKRLGASVDWSREYFTMDERLSVAVKEAFVRLWEQGLIYRGAYIVNWDPVLKTAVSDLEVTHEERQGKLYEIRYPLIDGPLPDGTASITIATTRPETLLGDTAVAVNPNDERYKALIGKRVRVPFTGVNGGPDREVSIIADDWAQPEFGTGAVKVTPAHDPNDFAIGQRHKLPSLTILDENAHVLLPGSPYHSLDRYAAREKLIADLEAAGLLAGIKDHTLAIGVSQRTGAVIEPRLSDQWFLAVNKETQTPNGKYGILNRKSMAAHAIDAVTQGHIQFTPEMYKKIYLEWMTNIHDWCISRQLWWGHRIPAWHCAACKEITVARETPTHCQHCNSTEITQETDVLDTWFSSGLLPFTVFGWPGDGGKPTADLAAFYPTHLLVTGFDILFFWVARMIMLGCHFMLDVPMPDGSKRALKDAVPFREVYIHGLVRDANREKMSKTKGNVINPIEIVEKYGTDAVRFTLASMASPGTDIAFSEGRTEGYRAFANKIWNAARFLFMQLDAAEKAGYEATNPSAPNLPENTPLETRWIFSRLSAVSTEVARALAAYRFDEAASAVYQFFWGEFCDWYLELVKLRLDFGDNHQKNEITALTLKSLVTVFEAALRLLSPFMPFLTEEVWHALYNNQTPTKSIALTRYPQASDYPHDPIAIDHMLLLQNLIVGLRSYRKDLGIPEKEPVPAFVVGLANYTLNNSKFNLITQNREMIQRLAKVSSIEALGAGDPRFKQQQWRDIGSTDIALLYERQIDVAAERERLTKELAKLEKGLAAAEKQLGNEAFMAKAPAHIVEGLRKQSAETRMLYDKARTALEALPK